jgi:acyl carrier protein
MSKTETELQQLWISLLGINHADKNDNYFDVGGNSFSLIHLHQQLESLYSISFDISELFTYSTIESQAKYIDGVLAKNINNKITDQRIDNTADAISLLEKFQEGKLDAASLKAQLGLSE